ncbi:MAG TPA: acylphosphatase [Acidimicrobiales bacterium]|nr:acylphosphatase [Acidimicrobiales bacterium]
MKVTVRGTVQGVGFRETCRHQADRQGVAGWVRNLSDGAVEAVFEGAADAVSAMVEWCRHGPPWAEVTDVELVEEQPQGEPGFRVR